MALEMVHIKSSFDNLLGLNTSRQLHDDIGLYMLRNSDGVDAEVEMRRKEHKNSSIFPSLFCQIRVI